MNGSGIEKLIGAALKGVSHMLKGNVLDQKRLEVCTVCGFIEPLIRSGKTSFSSCRQSFQLCVLFQHSFQHVLSS